jgi:hypothetical protein
MVTEIRVRRVYDAPFGRGWQARAGGPGVAAGSAQGRLRALAAEGPVTLLTAIREPEPGRRPRGIAAGDRVAAATGEPPSLVTAAAPTGRRR